MKKIGHFKILEEGKVFENKFIHLDDYVLFNEIAQKNQDYTVVRFKKKAAGIIPIDENGNTYIVGQYRFPNEKYSWELPEGGVEKHEEIIDGAKRELLEETNITAKNWLFLSTFSLSNSVCDEMASAFICWGFKELEITNTIINTNDPTEHINIKKITLSQLEEMIKSNEIWDGFTHQIYFHMILHYIRKNLPVDLLSLIDKTINK